MDVRENLVELIKDGIRKGLRASGDDRLDYSFEDVADYLISNGVTVQEWISVDDRLPEEKVNCIVHYKHAYCDNDGYWEIGFCFYDGEKFRIDLAYKVTHWMPIHFLNGAQNYLEAVYLNSSTRCTPYYLNT